jgi:hypothetical protein
VARCVLGGGVWEGWLGLVHEGDCLDHAPWHPRIFTRLAQYSLFTVDHQGIPRLEVSEPAAQQGHTTLLLLHLLRQSCLCLRCTAPNRARASSITSVCTSQILTSAFAALTEQVQTFQAPVDPPLVSLLRRNVKYVPDA